MRFVKLSAKESAALAIDAALIFWQQARIPTRRKDKCAEKLLKMYDDWKGFNKYVAYSFDTTSSNTGPNSGACVLLEEILGRKLIYLGCRHHMYEIVLKNVFEKKFGATSAPETPIFNRFADKWPEIKQDQFNSALNDSIVRAKISNVKRLFSSVKTNSNMIKYVATIRNFGAHNRIPWWWW